MFVTQGPLDPESRLFTGRAAELERMETWLTNAHCVGAVLGARQTGKTSLLLKLRHAMAAKYGFVFVDLEAVAQADITECLNFIAREMIDQLPLEASAIAPTLLKERSDFLSFLETYARAVRNVRIVVLLDEIGALLPETALRLSSVIRAVFTTRYVKTAFARYVFVLAGATDMLELTSGRNSPLKNVADSLYLGDLSASETGQLVAAMFGHPQQGSRDTIFQTLHDWTGGHPYWTQMLGEALGRDGFDMSERTVKSTVDDLLRTEDRNLPHVFSALQADGSLSHLVEALLAGTPIPFTRANRAIAKLELIGLLKNEKGRCTIRNRIYRAALEEHPVRRPRVAERDLRRLTRRFLTCRDAETLLEAATADMQATVQNLSVMSFMKVPGESGFRLVSSTGIGDDHVLRFAATDLLARIVSGAVKPSQVELPERERGLLERFDIALILPVLVNDEPVAFFWLGRKLSGDEYDARDVDVLNALAEQTATALDRLRLRTFEVDAEKAWRIQQNLLPRTLPQIPGLQIAASCRPARLVAGDYYDALQLSDHSVAICIADVIGKGLPAALLMANLQAAVRQAASETVSAAALCAGVNRLIAGNVQPGQFITFFYGLVDVARHRIVYTSAGHNPPILVRHGGSVERLGEGGPPLGLFPEWNHRDQELSLERGDRLLLFTDGVTELRNSQDEEFGEDRLIAIVRSSLDAVALHQRVVDALHVFSGGAIQDDVTIVGVTLDRTLN